MDAEPSAVDSTVPTVDAPPDEIRRLITDALKAQQASDFADARNLFEQVIEREPENADGLYLFGSMLGQAGSLSEARPLLERAIAAAPDMQDAYAALANVLTFGGDAAAGADVLCTAVERWPEEPVFRSNLASALIRISDINGAGEAARKAIALAPDFPMAHHNLGIVLSRLGDNDSAERSFERALELEPDAASTLTELGRARFEKGQMDEARELSTRALAIDENLPEPHLNLGTIAQQIGDIETAKKSLKHYYDLAPSDALRLKLGLVVPHIIGSVEDIKRTRDDVEDHLDEMLCTDLTIENPGNEVGSPPFFLSYHGLGNAQIHRKLAGVLERACPDLLYTAPHCAPGVANGSNDSVVRVGFVSTFFHDHTIGHLMRGILLGMDRSRFDIRLFTFAGAPDDLFARQFKEAANSHVALPRDFRAAQRLVADAELDVLMYPDIGMHAFTYYLAFARLAPVQCMTWGHPDTTGIGNVDYFLSCKHIEPDGADAHYTETLVREDALNFYYEPPPVFDEVPSRDEFELPANRHLYLCPQTLFKLHPDFDTVMRGILEADSDAQVVLLQYGTGHYADLLRKRWQESLGDLGARVRFVPGQTQAGYRRLCATADVILDPPHFSGGRTTKEILAAGTPIVTLRGDYMRSWVTYGIYEQMGVKTCVAQDIEDYVEKSVRLGTEPQWRGEVVGEILSRVERLYDNQLTVRQLERFFERIVDSQ